MNNLHNNWISITSAYTLDQQLIDRLWEEIYEAYSQNKRTYHNLNHINYMIDKVDDFQDIIDNKSIMLFSIFYHDIVYNVRRKDNEEQSAMLAEKRLKEIGLSSEKIQKCYHQIVATKDHQIHEDSDTNILTDIDLMILGEIEDVYDEYCRQIRAEYKIYPNFLYRKGRKKVIEHFLDMDRIFKTERVFDTHEEQARKNLLKELSGL